MTVTQLREGDYRPDGAGGFALATGGAGVLERVLFLLTARRGGFPLLPEVGSRLYLLSRARPSARGALGASYAAEALAGGGKPAGIGCGLDGGNPDADRGTGVAGRTHAGGAGRGGAGVAGQARGPTGGGKHMKTVEEIYREMMDRFSQETGMEPNGTGEMAVRMYALAAQVYGLYEGAGLDLPAVFSPDGHRGRTGKTWVSAGIARNPARQASGTLRFSVQEAVEEDLEIAQGTVCMTAGLVAFETTQAGGAACGGAICGPPGPGGGTRAGGQCVRRDGPHHGGGAGGGGRLYQSGPVYRGREEEGDEELRARILATYQQLPNGTNGAYYAQEALAVEGVTAVRVLPKNRGMGTVDVIIAGVEGLPGEELLRQVQERLEQKREIAVDVAVLAPEPVAVRLILSVKPKPGLLPGPVIARVQEAMETWFDGSMLGRDLLLAQIGQRIYQVEGVDNYRIEGPANDVVVAENQLPVLESVSVEELR